MARTRAASSTAATSTGIFGSSGRPSHGFSDAHLQQGATSLAACGAHRRPRHHLRRLRLASAPAVDCPSSRPRRSRPIPGVLSIVEPEHRASRGRRRDFAGPQRNRATRSRHAGHHFGGGGLHLRRRPGLPRRDELQRASMRPTGRRTSSPKAVLPYTSADNLTIANCEGPPLTESNDIQERRRHSTSRLLPNTPTSSFREAWRPLT